MQKKPALIVVLGTGGTIAGAADSVTDGVGYRAGVIGADQLVAAQRDAGQAVEVAQLAQVDSKDMGVAIWRRMALAVAHHLARPEVTGIVITHGTDTLEETAYFLHRLLAPAKPVVLVAAMRPATSVQADGPGNLLDAFSVAREPGARGVVAVLAGRVHGAADVRKVHAYRLDAFSSGDAGDIATVEEGRVRLHRAWPGGAPLLAGNPADWLPEQASAWPKVAIVTSHAGADGSVVAALRAVGVQGLVVAGTGNGTVHEALEAALYAAQAQGVAVLRCSRIGGAVVQPAGARGSVPPGAGQAGQAPPCLPSAGALTPVQARIELLLRQLAERVPRR